MEWARTPDETVLPTDAAEGCDEFGREVIPGRSTEPGRFYLGAAVLGAVVGGGNLHGRRF